MRTSALRVATLLASACGDDGRADATSSGLPVEAAELHVVPLERGPCGQIIGFGGGAVKLLNSPFLDLMTNGPEGVVSISHYPNSLLSQRVPGEATLASTIDL